MRLCVVGNSHAGCLKLAWDELRKSQVDTSLTFFAASPQRLVGLRLDGSTLKPETPALREIFSHTSGGLDVVDLLAYDAILLVGLEVSALMPGAHLLSRAALRQCLLDHTPTSSGYVLAKRIREAVDLPLFVMSRPLTASLDDSESNRDIGPYRRGLGLLSEAFFSPLDVGLFGQPEHTITNGYYTRREYSIGAHRLDVGKGAALQPSDDRLHMNGKFGALWLSAYLPLMAASCATP
jgi:hypothetical protein